MLKQSKFEVTLENTKGNKWLQQKFAIQIAAIFSKVQQTASIQKETTQVMLWSLTAQGMGERMLIAVLPFM